MNGGLPTERQLRGIEQRVLGRIRRRAAIRARIASGATVAALVVGAVVLVHPSFAGFSSGASGGSAAGSGAGTQAAAAAAGVRCHATSGRTSAARVVPLPSHPSAASLAAACAASEGAPGSSAPAAAPVVCRNGDGSYEVFPMDGHPATLCARNGMSPVR